VNENKHYVICDVEVTTVLLYKFGVKIPSGYGNNDDTLLWVTFYWDTL